MITRLRILILSAVFAAICMVGCEKADNGDETAEEKAGNINGIAKVEPEVLSTGSAFKVLRDIDGKHWFVDPSGKQFLTIGINNVVPEPWNPRPNTEYYDAVNTVFGGDFEKWKQDTVRLLAKNGFNTLGAWSEARLYDTNLYGTICLYIAGYEHDRCLDGLRPGFEEKIRKNAEFMLSKYNDLENVMGVFLDNEMPWNGKSAWEDVANYRLLDIAFAQPKADPAYQAAADFLKNRYKTIADFSKTWGKNVERWEDVDAKYLRSCVNTISQKDRADFTGIAAEKFFARACPIVREILPGKLILGTRFGGKPPEQVVRACGKFCDVISFNDYSRLPEADADELAEYWIWSGKRPLIVTEYSWRAEENTSGNPNSAGAGTVVKTQADRAANYKAYVEDLLSYPMVIGAHWFEFEDQSPQGRFDGEDSNYGIVDLQHRPYNELLKVMAETNANIADLHKKSLRKEPAILPKSQAVVFQPGQHPLRPPSVDLLNETPVMPQELFHAPDAKIAVKHEEGKAVYDYDSGDQWGFGILFFGPKSSAVGRGPEHTTDLDSYSVLEIDAEIPSGLFFDLFVDEAGVNKIDAGIYNIAAGDDAESFEIRDSKGKGKRFVYKFELKDLEVRTDWGNQKGKRRVDMQALKGFALFFHSGQGDGTINIYSVKLRR